MSAAVLDWLAVASTRVVLVFVVALVIDRLVLRTDVERRAQVWRAALVAIALVGVLPVRGTGPAVLPRIDTAGPRVVDAAPRASSPLDAAAPDIVAAGVPSFDRAELVEPKTERAALPPIRWRHAIALLWAAGVVLRMIELAVARSRLRGHMARSAAIESGPWVRDAQDLATRFGLSNAPRMARSDWRGAPALVGLVRPTVLLPSASANWSATRRRGVVAHELAHVLHRDPWFRRLALVVRAVFWFHPAALWTSRAMSKYQELRCDRVALDAGVEPVEYAECLVDIARTARFGAAAMALPFVRRSFLEHRVRAVLGGRHGVEGSRGAFSIGAFVLLTATSGAMLVSAEPLAIDDERVGFPRRCRTRSRSRSRATST